jgi:MFS transporter, DHA3 family, tetracycline resistance protein
MKLFRSLTHRSFALLWSGQTISSLGDSLYQIALAWWVLEKTGSAAIMGTVLIFSSVPMLLFLLIGGVTVDRFSRLQVMLLSDLLRGVIVALITILAFTDRLEVWHVLIASTLFGLVDAFFHPAYAATIPDIIPSEFRPSANSLTVLSRQVSSVAGPALGAVLIRLGDTSLAFAFDTLSFFISAACIVTIPALPVVAAAATRGSSVLHDLREGINTVLGLPWLWITILVVALANITQSAPFRVALPFLVKDTLQADVDTLGLIYSIYSLGLVVGAVWLGRITKFRHRGPLAYIILAILGLMTLSFGLAIPIIGLLLVAFLRGLSFVSFDLIWTNTLQERVPRTLLGRVASIDYLGSYALLPFGYGLAGWATDSLGAPMVFVIGGAITAGLALIGLAHPTIRALD